MTTSGSAEIGGFDVPTQQSRVRRSLGYCPQFNALLGNLGGREHLEQYARIKGVRAMEQYAQGLIDHVGLAKFADEPCRTYSSGNKRKLSFGMAICGNPKVILLDEPAAGVDTGARRFLWTPIAQQTRAGRAVILTTHSMDECEALCQRLTILVGGRLKCIGTVSHLKQRYGGLYQLVINVGSTGDTARVNEFIKKHYASSIMIAMHGHTMKYSIDRNGDAASLSDIFEADRIAPGQHRNRGVRAVTHHARADFRHVRDGVIGRVVIQA